MGQDRSEGLDDDKLGGGDYPPEKPLGAETYGVTAAEQSVAEPLEERVAREEPEVHEGGAADQAVDDPSTSQDPSDELVRPAGDPASDSTVRDVANERVPPPAEENAVNEDGAERRRP